MTGRVPHAPRAADRDERVLAADGVELVHMGLALPLYGNGSQTLHTVLPRRDAAAAAVPAPRGKFDVVHIHAPYNPSFFMLAPFVLPEGTVGVGTYHSVFTPGRVARPRARAHARVAEPAARAHRRLGRVRRAARPLLPRVRLARDPERHRRGSLRAERAADRRAARERGPGRPLPRPLRPAQRPRHHARGLRPAVARARRPRAPVRGRRRPAAALLRRAGSRPRSPPPCTGPVASTGTARATTPRPTSSARPASARASAWCCSRR